MPLPSLMAALPLDISSPAVGEAPAPGGFWFNINAELVLYGATEPDASLTIDGQPVALRPDGTFSFRFALPDGRYALTVAATSADQESRRAHLQFVRDTEYQGEVASATEEPMLKPPPTDGRNG